MRWPVKELHKPYWHPWFAWYPVHIGETCVWLETVWRRSSYYDGGMGDGIVEHEYKLEHP